MTEEELSLDFVEELLAERDTAVGKPKYEVPKQTSQYVKSVAQAARCIFIDCGAPTYFRIKEQPYCTIHAIHYMGDLLDEKINHFGGLSPQLEQVMKAYEKMESHPQGDFENQWLNVNASGIVIERVDHQTLKILVDGKEYRRSPYVDIEGILVLSLLQMLR